MPAGRLHTGKEVSHMIDFETFEAFEGEKPYLLLDRHPDGTYLALQVDIGDVAAAIWSTETKRLVWSPEDACALSWLRGGTQLAALQAPLYEDIYPNHRFAIYTWPQGQRLAQCLPKFPFGYVFDLVVSPTNDLAICQWADQSEFGFEFLTLSDHSIVHLSQQGYIKRGTNRTTRPVFQPGGHLWVCAYQDNLDWYLDEDAQRDGHYVAKEGKRERLGALLVFYQTHLLGEIPLIATVPASYCAEEGVFREVMGYLSESPPVFLDAHHVVIHLPSGESQMHDLSKFANEGSSR